MRWLIAMSLLLSSCGGESDGIEGAELRRSEKPRDTTPSARGYEVAALGRANRQFAYNLYQELAGTDGNVVLCPWSLVSGFGMSFAGARGTTAEQMDATLRFPDRPHPILNATLLSLAERDGTEGITVRTVNATWVRRGFDIHSEYLDLLAEHYGAGIFGVDEFSGSEPVVNAWFERQTNGEVDQIVPPGTFTSDTVVVLTNAVYFAAPWAEPFPAESTRPGTFHRLDGASVMVDMMSHRSGHDVASGDGWVAVRLGYTHPDFSMVLVLPDEGRFAEIEGAIGTVLDEAWLTAAPIDVIVRLPRFDVEQSSDLIPPLSELGMVDAFVAGTADFSGMTSETVHISAVRQQARVRIDERGTVAGAGTAIVDDIISLPEIIELDRPFIFGVFDARTEQILFLGRVSHLP